MRLRALDLTTPAASRLSDLFARESRRAEGDRHSTCWRAFPFASTATGATAGSRALTDGWSARKRAFRQRYDDDGLEHAAAEEAVWVAVAQLDRLIRPGRCAGGHERPAPRAVAKADVDLYGRVAARVEHLARTDVGYCGQFLAFARLTDRVSATVTKWWGFGSLRIWTMLFNGF